VRRILLLAAAALAVGACSAAQGVTPASPTVVPATVAADALPGTAAPSPAPTPVPSVTVTPPPPLLSPSPQPSSGTLVDPAAIGTPAPVGALVLGDSISLSVANELSRYGYPVIGLVGQSASESYLRMHLGTPLAQAAGTWVIVLGTNNSGSPDDVAQLERLVDIIDGLRTRAAKQQVRWVTPHRPEAYNGGRDAYGLDAFNAELSRLATERRWLRILDFDTIARANPQWFDADSMHLHPDQEGQDALVALITGPAPAAADTPAIVIDAAPSIRPSTSAEPETFDNATLPADPAPASDGSSAEAEAQPSDPAAGGEATDGPSPPAG